MTAGKATLLGIGDPEASFRVYMGNRPSYTFANSGKTSIEAPTPIESGEIHACGNACGNGWRKVFNVYAKLLFALSDSSLLDKSQYLNWQDYRDRLLLQQGSNTALYFTPPERFSTAGIHIVMGKIYAKTLFEQEPAQSPLHLTWLNDEFAINTDSRVIVCPYFDYRQLSNAKILYLIDLILNTFARNSPINTTIKVV